MRAGRGRNLKKMKKWLLLAFLPVLLSVIAHIYLAQRHYRLAAGELQESAICQISESLNCDQALLSPYGKFLGISVSSFGAGLNLALCLILLLFLIKAPRPGESLFWKAAGFYLSFAAAAASIIMLIVSLAMDLRCPVCMALYLLSFIPPAALWPALAGDVFSFSPLAFAKWLFLGIPCQGLETPGPGRSKQAKAVRGPQGGEAEHGKAAPAPRDKSGLFMLGGIMAGSLFLHMAFVNAFGIQSLSESVSAAFSDWRGGEAIEFSEPALLIMGASSKKKPKILIAEFADFLCPKCKDIQPALKKFLQARKAAALHFYIFPLDKTCSPSAEHFGSGASCSIALALICGAEQGRGARVHDLIFERQAGFGTHYADREKTSELLEELAKDASLDRDKFSLCMRSPAAAEKLRRSAKAGADAGVEGTPFIYVNGKRLRAGGKTLLPLLIRIAEHLR